MAIGGRAASLATRSFTTCQERAIEHAVLPWCETARDRRGRLQPFGAREFFPAHARAGETHAGRIAANHNATPHRSLSVFWYAGPAFHDPQGGIPRSMSPKTRQPEISNCPRLKFRGSTRLFLSVRGHATCRCYKHPKAERPIGDTESTKDGPLFQEY